MMLEVKHRYQNNWRNRSRSREPLFVHMGNVGLYTQFTRY